MPAFVVYIALLVGPFLTRGQPLATLHNTKIYIRDCMHEESVHVGHLPYICNLR